MSSHGPGPVGDYRGYDEDAYRLCICEKASGKYVLFMNLEGIRYLENELLTACHDMCGESYAYSEGDARFECSGRKLGAIRLSIDRPKKEQPEPSPIAFTKPGRLVYLGLRSAHAAALLRELERMEDRAVRGRTVPRVQLPYGVTLEYVADWEKRLEPRL